MRIVGGKNKGAQIFAPDNRETRPTSDRVREAMFNILAHGVDGFSLEGVRVLDLFAGTGALGLEALSRGARYVHFVDDSTQARGVVRRNADTLGEIGRCKIWRRDVARLGSCAPLPRFDLVFIDPPYGKGLGERALNVILDGGWLNDEALVVLEESAREEIVVPAGFETVSERTYGDTQVLILKATKVCP